MRNWKYISVRSDQSPTWEMLLLAADSDFISYLVLANYNIDIGSSLWLTQQAAEKYMKSFLLKQNNAYNIRRHGHNLDELWNETKSTNNTSQFFADSDNDTFIRELISVDIDSRYCFSINSELILFPRKFMQFCDNMRKLILENNYSTRGTFGLADSMFSEVRDIICPIILTEAQCFLHK
jgi:HEPN domain-containing protein